MSWYPRQTVVVPVDFSDESLTAVAVGVDIAAQRDGVHVVHVLPELSPAEPVLLWEMYESEKRRQAAGDELRKRLEAAGYADVPRHVFVGDPGQEIAAFAERQHADLIVMPSHGRTGVRRLLIGSVAERVVRLSHCPVLVLRK
ncbi:MAG: universal stress protein [Pirellulales bacterium]